MAVIHVSCNRHIFAGICVIAKIEIRGSRMLLGDSVDVENVSFDILFAKLTRSQANYKDLHLNRSTQAQTCVVIAKQT